MKHGRYVPGPYEARPIEGDRLNRWMVVCVNPQRCPGTGKEVVAYKIRTEATARLLAAAPDLQRRNEELEERLREAVEACVKCEELLSPFEESGFLGSQALNKVRAVIAKAQEAGEALSDDCPTCGEDHEGIVPLPCETGDGV